MFTTINESKCLSYVVLKAESTIQIKVMTNDFPFILKQCRLLYFSRKQFN